MISLRANHTQGLLQSVTEHLEDDERFHYLGKGATYGWWGTRLNKEDGWSPIDLTKNMAGKGNAEVKIVLHGESKDGVELKIMMTFPSYFSEDTVFEGFVNTMDEFLIVLKCIGVWQAI